MAIRPGWNNVTSGNRASHAFDFEGGRIGYLVLDAAAANTPDWDLEMQMPDNSWVRVHANGDQIDSAKNYDTLIVPAGHFRLHCDIATPTSAFTGVKLYWCCIPQTMQDAAIF